MKEMDEQVRSSLLGGLIAAVIWMVIATANNASNASVIGWGLGLLVFTTVVSYGVSTVIRRKRGA